MSETQLEPVPTATESLAHVADEKTKLEQFAESAESIGARLLAAEAKAKAFWTRHELWMLVGLGVFVGIIAGLVMGHHGK